MMSNEPPQGAQSADPVREAAQALIDLEDMRLRLRDLHERGHGTDYGDIGKRIHDAWLALRTALAAPEGPAPEPDCWAILTPNGSMLVSPDEAKGRKGAYPLYRAPEAPPPVEARQPHNPWRASIENILTGDNYFRAAEWHELLADLDRLYAMPPAVKPLDDPRLQQAFGDAIEGALAFGYQQNNKPPVGHWLNRFWNIGSAEAEKASKPPIVTDEMVTAYLKANDEYWRKVDEIAPPIGVWRNGTPREATRESLRAALAAPAGAIQPHLDHQVESSSGTAAALGRITLLKGSVVKMGGLPHELLADVESYCASRAAAPQGGDTGAPSPQPPSEHQT